MSILTVAQPARLPVKFSVVERLDVHRFRHMRHQQRHRSEKLLTENAA